VGEHSSPAGPQTTVLQMCMVGAGVANGGTVMTPHLMDHVMSPEGQTIKTATPLVFSQAISADVANQVSQAMEAVVDQGTGTAAQISGYTVRGKTGTAETNNPTDNSWFVGYVEVNGHVVTVAVLIEQAGEGTATPKAAQVLQTAIEVYGG